MVSTEINRNHTLNHCFSRQEYCARIFLVIYQKFFVVNVLGKRRSKNKVRKIVVAKIRMQKIHLMNLSTCKSCGMAPNFLFLESSITLLSCLCLYTSLFDIWALTLVDFAAIFHFRSRKVYGNQDLKKFLFFPFFPAFIFG